MGESQFTEQNRAFAGETERVTQTDAREALNAYFTSTTDRIRTAGEQNTDTQLFDCTKHHANILLGLREGAELSEGQILLLRMKLDFVVSKTSQDEAALDAAMRIAEFINTCQPAIVEKK